MKKKRKQEDMNKNGKFVMKKNIKKLSKGIGLLIGIVIIAFMIKEVVVNWRQVEPYILNMDVNWFVYSIIFNMAAFMFTACNWSKMVVDMDESAKMMQCVDVHITTVMAKYIPGGVWNIVGKAVLGVKKGINREAISSSMVLEYVFQISSSCFFLLFFLPTILFKTQYWYVMIFICICAVVIVILLPWLINLCNSIIAKILKEEKKVYMRKKFVYTMFFRYMLSWLLSGVALLCLMRSFEKITVVQGLGLVFSYPISWVAGFVSPSPGGMGVREFMLSLLLGSSFASSIILLISLTTRIWSIVSEVLSFVCFKIIFWGWCKKNAKQ